MTDVIAALVAFLKADGGVAALVGTRVYGIELPAGEAAPMPEKALVLRPSGGAALVAGYAGLSAQRIDAFAYGETPYEAARVDLAVYPALKQLRRAVAASVLVHWVTDAGGYSSFRDPATDWPAVFRSWQAFFAEPAAA
jgi:hypothetical protein